MNEESGETDKRQCQQASNTIPMLQIPISVILAMDSKPNEEDKEAEVKNNFKISA